MSELTLFLVRVAYLAILWIFVLSAISVIRSDMFGARLPSAPGVPRAGGWTARVAPCGLGRVRPFTARGQRPPRVSCCPHPRE